jgi:geranylgeranyl diphosphate synthase, type I
MKVDPIINKSLSNGSGKEFLPSLRYHFESGGKRMRAAMVLLSCEASGGRAERAIKPAAVIELIHNYSLVMDDLIDRGEVRRGRPTVRVVVGDSVALLVAMFYREVLDDLISQCVATNDIRRISVKAMKEIIDGERLDLMFEQAGRVDPYLIRNRISKPSFSLYLNMIGKKTAALFKAAGEVGAYSAGANPSVAKTLGSFGWKAGIAFQVMDDVLDICGDKTGKQQAKDIVEHKMGNAVVLVAMRFLSKRNAAELRDILRIEKMSHKTVVRARNLVNETPAETVCREIASKYLSEAKNHLLTLKKSTSTAALARLADLVVERSF